MPLSLFPTAEEIDAMSWQQMLEWGKLPIKVWKELAAVLGDERVGRQAHDRVLGCCPVERRHAEGHHEQYQPSSR